MADTYWHKQSTSDPLFPKLLWSRPENNKTAGKLLIIGGNLHGFAAPAEAFATAVKAGIGTAKVLLPDALKKTVGRILDNGEFAPSTPSGSFSQSSLAEWLDYSSWANGVLIAGDIGRNSETAIVLENYLEKSSQSVTISRDAVDYLYTSPQTVLERPNTTVVLSLSQLQKLVKAAVFQRPVTFNMDLLQLVDLLHEFTKRFAVNIITQHQHHILVAVRGQVSTTPCDQDIWRTQAAAHATVWWLQNPTQTFDALTTAMYELVSNN